MGHTSPKAFPNRFQHGTRCTWPQAKLHANSAIANVTANQDVIVQVSISGLYTKLVNETWNCDTWRRIFYLRNCMQTLLSGTSK